ncbi:MAG: class I SAM-dependent methyltransferase [Deltaproteobacteria bacterium]|nr:class I SAM-dependent methyltransferase [Deltaproteobacteria bacterium]
MEKPGQALGDAIGEGYAAAMSARYDADFEAIFGGPDRGDLDFFRAIAASAGGPIAEIGAGTGRVALAVADAAAGEAVVGVEPSEGMRAAFEARLAAADPRLSARVCARAGTFASAPLPDASQALVYSAFRSFQHLLSPDEQLAGLVEMRRALRPGGTVAIDLFDPDYRLLHDAEPFLVARYPRAGGGTIERYDSRRILRAEQLVEVGFRWIERDARRRVVADERGSYRIRYTFPYELVHLVARAGFADVALFGDYDGSPLGDDPRELVLVAKRPGAKPAA